MLLQEAVGLFQTLINMLEVPFNILYIEKASYIMLPCFFMCARIPLASSLDLFMGL